MSNRRRLATLIGDVVGSRTASDRHNLHESLTAGLARVNRHFHPVDPLRLTVGDEFQGAFEHLGHAIDAAFRLRLDLAPHIDIRYGIGQGEVTMLDTATGIQDGPGWWAARRAIERTKTLQDKAATSTIRTSYETAYPGGTPDQRAITAALHCRDHLLGSLDERSLRILKGMMENRTKTRIAADEGISPSAVSQRAGRDGLGIIVDCAANLRELP